MKVLQLGKFYPIRGGVEKVMYDLTQGLSERGIQCDMLCACKNNKEIILNDQGRIFCAKSCMKMAATMISPSMIMMLRKMAEKYDVVHVHHPDPMACLALFLSGYKGKVVLHWHSDILKQKVLLKFFRPLQQWMVSRADVIVGTTPVYVQQSPFLSKVQSKVDYIPIGIQEVIPNEVEVRKIRSRYVGKKIVYSLGRLVGYKGYGYLIDAARYLGDDYVVLIGGEGPQKEELIQQIRKQGLEGKVELLGYIEEHDSANYFGACDVFCLSSVWKTEAFAIVQVEAMCCGKPVVATNILGSGVSWVNLHEYSGLNVPTADSKALARAIEALTENPEAYQKYARQARNLYESRYTYEQMIERCIALYGRLFDNNNNNNNNGR